MRPRHPSLPSKLPGLWLITDARNDDLLEEALLRLPRGSGVVFRHYHLAMEDRRLRFDQVSRLARRRGHSVILSGNARQARSWHADGAYGPASALAHGPDLPRLVTAHSMREIGAARRARACAVLLSPVFATRSHRVAKALGPVRFHMLARRAGLPVIALGGMNRIRARSVGPYAWAAIDGLS